LKQRRQRRSGRRRLTDIHRSKRPEQQQQQQQQLQQQQQQQQQQPWVRRRACTAASLTTHTGAQPNDQSSYASHVLKPHPLSPLYPSPEHAFIASYPAGLGAVFSFLSSLSSVIYIYNNISDNAHDADLGSWKIRMDVKFCLTFYLVNHV